MIHDHESEYDEVCWMSQNETKSTTRNACCFARHFWSSAAQHFCLRAHAPTPRKFGGGGVALNCFCPGREPRTSCSLATEPEQQCTASRHGLVLALGWRDPIDSRLPPSSSSPVIPTRSHITAAAAAAVMGASRPDKRVTPWWTLIVSDNYSNFARRRLLLGLFTAATQTK